MFPVSNRHVAAVMAPNAVPSATTSFRPLLWCLSTSKAQLLFAWMALIRHSLVVINRRHQLLMADNCLLAAVLPANVVSFVIMVPKVSSSARASQQSFPIIDGPWLTCRPPTIDNGCHWPLTNGESVPTTQTKAVLLISRDARWGVWGFESGGSGRHSFWCHSGGYMTVTNGEHDIQRSELYCGVWNYSDKTKSLSVRFAKWEYFTAQHLPKKVPRKIA